MEAAHHVDNDAVFAEEMRAKLKRTSIGDGVMKSALCDLHNLLILERRNVLFVGEGNFTFSVAFGALRERVRVPLGNISDPGLVWNGITYKIRTNSVYGPRRQYSFIFSTLFLSSKTDML